MEAHRSRTAGRAVLICLLSWLLRMSVVCGQNAGVAAADGLRRAISYLTTPGGDADAYARERCVLDLYLPTGIQRFPTIVWFHEGDFSSATRTIPEAFKQHGIAVAAPDYRLSPKVACEQAVADAAQAVAYILRNIEALGGDPARVFVAGSGTGGYIAALVVLDKSRLGACGMEGAAVAGLVSINGTACTHPAVLRERGEDTVGRVVADRLAPMHHVRKDAPPLLLATADRRLESSELYESNAYMWRMLQVAGHRSSRLCELQGYACADVEVFLPLVPRFVSEQCGKLDAGGEGR